MAEVEPEAWDALAKDLDNPFFEWAWLNLLEESGSAAAARGWFPNHLLVQADGRLVGAIPLYLKWHSEGEFVFDQLWGEAASRLGLPYYPRLVGATPFTPATGLRFLTDPSVNQSRLARRMVPPGRRRRSPHPTSHPYPSTNSRARSRNRPGDVHRPGISPERVRPRWGSRSCGSATRP